MLKDHYYIGKHHNTLRWDSYTGSGKVIKDYFKKYRAKNHITYEKEILEYCDTIEKLNELEIKYIGDLWKTDPLCLNLMGGGGGGEMPKGENNPWYGCHHTEEAREKISKGKKGKQFSEEHKKHLSEAKIGQIPWNKGTTGLMNPWNKGKTGCFSEEAIKKMSESHIGQVSTRRKKIIATIIETGEEEYYDSIKLAAKALGLLTPSNISSALNGRRKSCANRTWAYA